MRPKTLVPCLEALEDRLTPSLTYVLSAAGSLSVTGITTNPSVTITSTAAGVTVMDGAASKTFAVTGNLTVNVLMTNATPVLNYDPGVNTLGNVSLTATAAGPVTLNVAGAANVNVNGLLSVTTGAGNDSINIDNVNPAGLTVNSGAGQDFVLVGFNNPVTVRGNLTATNVNLIGLGVQNGPAVVVQGSANITTDLAPGITFNTPNNVNISNNTVIQGNLVATINGAFQLFSTMGSVGGSAYVSLGGGLFDQALFQDLSTVGGNITVTEVGGAVTQVGVSGTVGGNLGVFLGNGGNVFAFNGTLLGTSITYHGGNGNDIMTVGAGASAPGARLTAVFGNGNDTVSLNSDAFASLYLDGGFGANIFVSTVTLTAPITLRNF